MSNRVVWPDGSRNAALSIEAAQPVDGRPPGSNVAVGFTGI